MTEFHASFISDSEVELAWEPVHMKDEDEQVDHYEIYFKELNNNSDSGSPFDHESVSSLYCSEILENVTISSGPSY